MDEKSNVTENLMDSYVDGPRECFLCLMCWRMGNLLKIRIRRTMNA